MRKRVNAIAAAAVIGLLGTAGCGGGGAGDGGPAAQAPTTVRENVQSSPPPPSSASPTAVARSAKQHATVIKAAVPTVTRIIQISEDNDPNDKIGRPNGYTDASVLYDRTVTCTELGVDCGATVEIWPTADDAKARAAYIQGILKGAPTLGAEYDYLNGSALLRVAGGIKPSKVKAYAAAFGGELYGG